MNIPLAPKPGFDWTRVQWTGPYALVEWERCSYCDGAITDDARTVAHVEQRRLLGSRFLRSVHGPVVGHGVGGGR